LWKGAAKEWRGGVVDWMCCWMKRRDEEKERKEKSLAM
jgi:hypothetical protein